MASDDFEVLFHFYIPYALTVYFPHMCSVKYLLIFNTLYFYIARILNHIVLLVVIQMAKILYGKVHIAFS